MKRRKLKIKNRPKIIADLDNEVDEMLERVSLEHPPTTPPARITGPPQPKQPKVLKRYPKQKCAYVYPGTKKKCNNWAVGKVDVCKRHGGNPVIMENLLETHEITDIALGTRSKYDPAFHPFQLLIYAKSGMSPIQIAAEFGISTGTLEKWAMTYKDMYEAFEIAKTLHEAWYIKHGQENLDNRNYNTALFKFMAGNLHGWAEKTESRNLNVNAGVLVVPGQVTEEEWNKEYVQDKDKK